MSAKRKIAAAVAIGALFFTANEASAQHQTHGHDVRHLPRAFERAWICSAPSAAMRPCPRCILLLFGGTPAIPKSGSRF